MKKLLSFKKGIIIILFTAIFLVTFMTGYNLQASTGTKPYINDNFDKGLDEKKWQIVNDEEKAINFAKQEGTLRYDISSGGEQAIVTTNQLTKGDGIIGYQVQFDLNYKTDDWGAWYAFAFNKIQVDNGLDWAKSGYLMGRTSSLQTNNPADSSSTGDDLDAYSELSPEIPTIAFQNITFKFVYKNNSKTVDVYYDIAGVNADLDTLRVTYTFGGLDTDGEYHFAIIGSSGKFEIDNFIIDQLKDTDIINVLTEDFESTELSKEITLPKEDEFSFGPAGTLRFEDVDDYSLVASKKPFVPQDNVHNIFKLKVDIYLESLSVKNTAGIIYGLENANSKITNEGTTLVSFSNRDVDGEMVTFITAIVGDGEKENVVYEQKIDVNLEEFFTLELRFTSYGITTIFINDKKIGTYNGGERIGYYGLKGSLGNTIEFDNFFSWESFTIDQKDSPDLYYNFNNGYISEEDFEIWNFIDKKPGSETPLFTTTKNIHLADGKLVFDVVSESSALYTQHSYTDFEMKFEISNFGKPVTPMNEDGEIEGIEIPETLYIAVGFGYETNADNFWDVTTIIYQDRFGTGVVYGMNMGDNTSYQVPEQLRMGTKDNENETFQFKYHVLNGVVKLWVKRASDPSDIFDGEPLIEYRDQNTTGRIGISSSSLGSFALDNFSLRKIDNDSSPEIPNKENPELIDGPKIMLVENKETFFYVGSESPDFKTYFTVSDGQDGNIVITDDMINTNNFDINVVGQYEIILTVKDSDNNIATKLINVAVSNGASKSEKQNKTVLIILLLIGGLSVGAGGFWSVTKILNKKK